jgi:MFS family permease
MYWKISRSLIIAVNLITDTFLAFFIWEQNNNLKLVLYYGLIFFASVPIGALVAAVITEYIAPKVSILLAAWLVIIQILILLAFKEDLTIFNILLIGFIGGVSEGLMAVGVNVVDFENGVKDHAKFYASHVLIKEILTLLIPLGAAYLIHISSYSTVFKITVGIVILAVISVLSFKTSYVTNKFEPDKVFSFPGTNKDKHTLAWGTFLEGLSEGVTFTILPIILLSMVGNVLNWGYINTALVFVAIIFSFFIRNIVNDKNSKILFMLGATFFALAGMLFLNELSFTILILFLLAKMLMDVIKEVSYYSSLEKIMEEDRQEYHLHGEYEFFVQVFTSLGRVIPIALLLAINIQLADQVNIRLILLTVGLMPLIIISVLGKSAVFKTNYESEMQIRNIREIEGQEVNSNSANLPKLKPQIS